MYPVFESIRIMDGQAERLDYHIARMQYTASQLWSDAVDIITLHEQLRSFQNAGLFKCKVYYNQHNLSCSFEPYFAKQVQRLCVVQDDDLCYNFKFTNRAAFEHYENRLKQGEQIAFCKHGFLTDASYANIVLWNGHEWHTPRIPLLHGTRRKHLLDQRILHEKDITLEDVSCYQYISLINAMIPLDTINIPIDQVYIDPFG
jgi:4-amino-4-deoxychorismate lyase